MDLEKGAPDRLPISSDAHAAFAGDAPFDFLEKALGDVGPPAETEDPRGRPARRPTRGHRNGYPNKRAFAPPPRFDRDASVALADKPLAVDPHGFASVQQKILSMYARGMSVREIRCHLFELYGADFSSGSVSMAIDAVPEMIGQWRGRPLEAAYPLVFFDMLRVKVREDGLVRNKVIFIALGIQADGEKEILGLWIENADGANVWLKMTMELKNRGVRDILIAVVDGSKGVPEAINAVFPRTIVQTCIVHLIRQSMDFPEWADRKALASALDAIYQAEDAAAASAALNDFAAGPWGQKYPAVVQMWRRDWEQVIPFFAFPEAVRRIIYARKAVESLNGKLRRAARARGNFASDDAALFLVLRNGAEERKMPPRVWREAKIQLAGMFDERFVRA